MPNILICDDERDIVSALKIYLSDPDYTLFEACNGLEAVAIAEREDIHLILMESGVAIVENAVLSGVPDGDYLIFAFPMKYGGCDGAPVRAVLICEGEETPEKTEVFSGAAGRDA